MLNDAGLSDFSERAKYGTSNRQGQNQNGYVRPLRVARKTLVLGWVGSKPRCPVGRVRLHSQINADQDQHRQHRQHGVIWSISRTQTGLR